MSLILSISNAPAENQLLRQQLPERANASLAAHLILRQQWKSPVIGGEIALASAVRGQNEFPPQVVESAFLRQQTLKQVIVMVMLMQSGWDNLVVGKEVMLSVADQMRERERSKASQATASEENSGVVGEGGANSAGSSGTGNISGGIVAKSTSVVEIEKHVDTTAPSAKVLNDYDVYKMCKDKKTRPQGMKVRSFCLPVQVLADEYPLFSLAVNVVREYLQQEDGGLTTPLKVTSVENIMEFSDSKVKEYDSRGSIKSGFVFAKPLKKHLAEKPIFQGQSESFMRESMLLPFRCGLALAVATHASGFGGDIIIYQDGKGLFPRTGRDVVQIGRARTMIQGNLKSNTVMLNFRLPRKVADRREEWNVHVKELDTEEAWTKSLDDATMSVARNSPDDVVMVVKCQVNRSQSFLASRESIAELAPASTLEEAIIKFMTPVFLLTQSAENCCEKILEITEQSNREDVLGLNSSTEDLVRWLNITSKVLCFPNWRSDARCYGKLGCSLTAAVQCIDEEYEEEEIADGASEMQQEETFVNFSPLKKRVKYAETAPAISKEERIKVGKDLNNVRRILEPKEGAETGSKDEGSSKSVVERDSKGVIKNKKRLVFGGRRGEAKASKYFAIQDKASYSRSEMVSLAKSLQKVTQMEIRNSVLKGRIAVQKQLLSNPNAEDPLALINEETDADDEFTFQLHRKTKGKDNQTFSKDFKAIDNFELSPNKSGDVVVDGRHSVADAERTRSGRESLRRNNVEKRGVGTVMVDTNDFSSSDQLANGNCRRNSDKLQGLLDANSNVRGSSPRKSAGREHRNVRFGEIESSDGQSRFAASSSASEIPQVRNQQFAPKAGSKVTSTAFASDVRGGNDRLLANSDLMSSFRQSSHRRGSISANLAGKMQTSLNYPKNFGDVCDFGGENNSDIEEVPMDTGDVFSGRADNKNSSLNKSSGPNNNSSSGLARNSRDTIDSEGDYYPSSDADFADARGQFTEKSGRRGSRSESYGREPGSGHSNSSAHSESSSASDFQRLHEKENASKQELRHIMHNVNERKKRLKAEKERCLGADPPGSTNLNGVSSGFTQNTALPLGNSQTSNTSSGFSQNAGFPAGNTFETTAFGASHQTYLQQAGGNVSNVVTGGNSGENSNGGGGNSGYGGSGSTSNSSSSHGTVPASNSVNNCNAGNVQSGNAAAATGSVSGLPANSNGNASGFESAASITNSAAFSPYMQFPPNSFPIPGGVLGTKLQPASLQPFTPLNPQASMGAQVQMQNTIEIDPRHMELLQRLCADSLKLTPAEMEEQKRKEDLDRAKFDPDALGLKILMGLNEKPLNEGLVSEDFSSPCDATVLTQAEIHSRNMQWLRESTFIMNGNGKFALLQLGVDPYSANFAAQSLGGLHPGRRKVLVWSESGRGFGLSKLNTKGVIHDTQKRLPHPVLEQSIWGVEIVPSQAPVALAILGEGETWRSVSDERRLAVLDSLCSLKVNSQTSKLVVWSSHPFLAWSILWSPLSLAGATEGVNRVNKSLITDAEKSTVSALCAQVELQISTNCEVAQSHVDSSVLKRGLDLVKDAESWKSESPKLGSDAIKPVALTINAYQVLISLCQMMCAIKGRYIGRDVLTTELRVFQPELSKRTGADLSSIITKLLVIYSNKQQPWEAIHTVEILRTIYFDEQTSEMLERKGFVSSGDPSSGSGVTSGSRDRNLVEKKQQLSVDDRLRELAKNVYKNFKRHRPNVVKNGDVVYTGGVQGSLTKSVVVNAKAYPLESGRVPESQARFIPRIARQYLVDNNMWPAEVSVWGKHGGPEKNKGRGNRPSDNRDDNRRRSSWRQDTGGRRSEGAENPRKERSDLDEIPAENLRAPPIPRAGGQTKKKSVPLNQSHFDYIKKHASLLERDAEGRFPAWKREDTSNNTKVAEICERLAYCNGALKRESKDDEYRTARAEMTRCCEAAAKSTKLKRQSNKHSRFVMQFCGPSSFCRPLCSSWHGRGSCTNVKGAENMCTFPHGDC